MREMDRVNQLELAKRVVLDLTSPKGLAEMRRIMNEWANGPTSANLDGRGHDRYEDHADADGQFSARVPSDPTGEGALRQDEGQDALEEADRLLADLFTTASQFASLYDEWSPRGARKVKHDDGFTDDWCWSCWRVDKTCTPITRRLNGRPYHVGLCRWCGDTRTALRMRRTQAPPVKLVRMHLEGKPISKKLAALHTVKTKGRKGRRAA